MQMTPWNRDLYEKLVEGQVVKKFAAFYDFEQFIIMFIDCKWVDTRWQWRHPVAVVF